MTMLASSAGLVILDALAIVFLPDVP